MSLTLTLFQPLMLTDVVTFRNILITMQLKTVKSDLPTYFTVHAHITNCFVNFLAKLKADIAATPGKISGMCNTWTTPHTSDPMFSLLVQWIEILKEGTWVFCDEVAVFHKILGNHGGTNLGCYLILFLDCCGVTSWEHSKVSSAMVMNTLCNVDSHSLHSSAISPMIMNKQSGKREGSWTPSHEARCGNSVQCG